MEFKIAVLQGDGIGPEITNAAISVLDAVAIKFGHKFNYRFPLIGGAAIDRDGVPLPQSTIDECKSSQAVLLGAVGGPKWDNLPGHLRPEKGLLGIRNALGLYANIRPALLHSELKGASPLKNEITKNGIDLVVVRELIGGIYFGERGLRNSPYGKQAYDTEAYSVKEVERIARIAFDLAKNRRRKVTSVDKANVLDSSKLWRTTVAKVAESFPDVQLENMFVDNAAMQLVRDPSQFDVILTSNMFGDILSDEAAMITGSIGLLPSSSLGDSKCGLFEPIHGSAPDIAGKDAANPIATILSAAMLLVTSLDLPAEATAVENAVKRVLSKGWRTPDIYSTGSKKATCSKMGELIALEVLNA